jgi:hypothetical protein
MTRARSVAFGAAAATLLAACGYRPLHAQTPPGDRLAVVIVSSQVTPTSAVDEVASGVREALAESGMLRAGSEYPRAEVEVVRIDTESEGIADVAGAPQARGLRIGVVARAWVKAKPGDGKTNDTGDVRVVSVIAAEHDPGLAAELSFERGARAAGRRTGLRLGARLVGHPSLSE